MVKEWVPGVVVLERGWLSSNNVVLRAPGPSGPSGPSGAATQVKVGLRAGGRGEDHLENREGGGVGIRGVCHLNGLAMVVDTGHVRHAALTVELLQEVTKGFDLVAVVNTHLHSDHCGGNAAVAERFNAQVLIPPGDFEAARAWDEDRLSFKETGQCCQAFVPSARLMPGSRLPPPFDRWEVHAAPGHDPASIILFDPASRVVISADALWENGFGIVFPELQGRDAFAEVEASLDLIECLKPASVIPGHGAPFTDVASALTRARARLTHFRRDPRRHALHAAKALMVFRVMEAERISLDDLVQWAAVTPVLERIRRVAEGDGATLQEGERELPVPTAATANPAADWVRPLIEELLRAGSLKKDPVAGTAVVLIAG